MLGFGGSYNKSKSSSSNAFSKTLTGEQQGALSGLSSYGQGLLTNPMEALKPMRTAAFQNVNDLYDRAPDQIAERLRSKGLGGQSGLKRRLSELDMQRYGKLAGVENQFAGLGIQQQAQGADILGQLLQQTFGYTQKGESQGSGFSIGGSVGK